ncbi:MAG TPA: imidazole glycerol phosphate synthase subunit HisF [Dictyoglomaceae bacterium]|nr:imidazole glycerol phosphate synthase subunit HisF [Dictyoglomaceae bacterium]HOL38693.1 imidazole glycerol phosphate synthase subunit HisF [Dictyoglomaceae bacterium]HOP94603.1 imidazole glycerol phosphate synthase subunit HisF [Dictyoglomaceae bacterium]HPP15558.1 imidazole glycerol phosphate synthase subunit HisF [Dictyoglomaceae bacterium]HPU42873.1 imidazole glycerol phosphate synthase subunit HisF [Dictyoglomaceae bacterium]
MLAKRIIPCLDTIGKNVVKGKSFQDLQIVGDAKEFAHKYEEEGADELVLLDITASLENRDTFTDVVTEVAEELFVPLTVGGGIKDIEDVRRLLKAGADKVSINTSAVLNPALMHQIAKEFGSQCLVVAIDVKRRAKKSWEVYIKGGKEPTDIDLKDWLIEVEKRGAGEILLTSIDADGHQAGYDLELLEFTLSVSNLPLIASGGAGSLEDLYNALYVGADAVLAASIFHFGTYSISEVKDYLKSRGIWVR